MVQSIKIVVYKTLTAHIHELREKIQNKENHQQQQQCPNKRMKIMPKKKKEFLVLKPQFSPVESKLVMKQTRSIINTS